METFLDGRVCVSHGDCRAVLDAFPEASFDACATDPPYHLISIVKRFGAPGAAPSRSNGGYDSPALRGFMGQTWDGGNLAFEPATWAAILRVLKPGGYLVACAHPRTYHRMACAIEDAGFVLHPMIAWIYGQGFPKAHRVRASGFTARDRVTDGWDGWRYGGQTLKPAIEPICMAQRPFAGKLTGTENVQRWGVGAINVDGCRIASEEANPSIERRNGKPPSREAGSWANDRRGADAYAAPHRGEELGRWPANVVTDGSAEVVAMFPDSDHARGNIGASKGGGGMYGHGPTMNNFGAGDEGSAARFFYTAKAGDDDRIGSRHPTVKPLALMQWLVRLITPPAGMVLDPFAGTGTAGEAAWREGMRAHLIEREAKYVDDIRRRMALALGGPEERARESLKASGRAKGHDDLPLFGGPE